MLRDSIVWGAQKPEKPYTQRAKKVLSKSVGSEKYTTNLLDRKKSVMNAKQMMQRTKSLFTAGECDNGV